MVQARYRYGTGTLQVRYRHGGEYVELLIIPADGRWDLIRRLKGYNVL